jgi:hypothetical protein
MASGKNKKRSDAGEATQLRKLLRAEDERRWSKIRTETLLDLANMTDGSCERFRKTFQRSYRAAMEDSDLLCYRERLRRIWSGNDLDGEAIHYWARQATLNNRQSWVVASGRGFWIVQPNYHILPLSLAIAVSEHGPRMALCANPHCPQKYFLKGRRTQQFCDLPTCAAFGQRQHKMKWWEAHKKELRARRKASEIEQKNTRRN